MTPQRLKGSELPGRLDEPRGPTRGPNHSLKGSELLGHKPRGTKEPREELPRRRLPDLSSLQPEESNGRTVRRNVPLWAKRTNPPAEGVSRIGGTAHQPGSPLVLSRPCHRSSRQPT